MIPIGHGVAAGFQDGRLMVITGSLFAQIERERRDGPRYGTFSTVEAMARWRANR